jgi:hypothetical protein
MKDNSQKRKKKKKQLEVDSPARQPVTIPMIGPYLGKDMKNRERMGKSVQVG